MVSKDILTVGAVSLGGFILVDQVLGSSGGSSQQEIKAKNARIARGGGLPPTPNISEVSRGAPIGGGTRINVDAPDLSGGTLSGGLTTKKSQRSAQEDDDNGGSSGGAIGIGSSADADLSDAGSLERERQQSIGVTTDIQQDLDEVTRKKEREPSGGQSRATDFTNELISGGI